MTLEDRARTHAALGDPHRLAIADALALGDRTPGELADLLSVPSNLLAHHLKVLEAAGVVHRRDSKGDGRRRYVVLDSSRLVATAFGGGAACRSVLFVCTHNSARSQFAGALWRSRTGLPADSAGSTPAASVHPKAIAVAAEMGLDLSGLRPKGYAALSAAPDLVVSVCDRAAESGVPAGARHLHWSIPDPAEDGRLRAFRAAFAEIRTRVDRLAAAVGSGG
jgi:protein-tyrosine-phosphatase/DNA-binding transcriptional ArsR family regulator